MFAQYTSAYDWMSYAEVSFFWATMFFLLKNLTPIRIICKITQTCIQWFCFCCCRLVCFEITYTCFRQVFSFCSSGSLAYHRPGFFSYSLSRIEVRQFSHTSSKRFTDPSTLTFFLQAITEGAHRTFVANV